MTTAAIIGGCFHRYSMSLRTYTEPSTEPITLAEAKLHLKVDTSDDDDLITSLIKAARIQCETLTGRTFITTTYELSLDFWPYASSYPYPYPNGIAVLAMVSPNRNVLSYPTLYLPKPSLISVTSINYVDTTGTPQTLSSGNYQVATGNPGRVIPAYGFTWPTTRSQFNAITIRYVAGYGDATTVPESVKAAIKLMVGHLYRNREAVGEAQNVVPMTVESLLQTVWSGNYSQCL